MHDFKVGDKVRCICNTASRELGVNFNFRGELEVGRVYTIKRIRYSGQQNWDHLELEEVSSYEMPSEKRFELARISNEERVQQRLEKLNA